MCTSPVCVSVCRKGNDYYELLQVPCGKCLECLNQKSTEWAYRIMDECKAHSDNCFITLTYENSPGQLVRKDLTDFIKRLRKSLDFPVRVFYTGEYGSHTLRPHYHLIVFGYFPTDCVFLRRDGSDNLYRSKSIEKLWTFGFSSVGRVSLQSAKYCAKYLQKLQKIPANLVQPFIGMSNRPGIGYSAISPKSLASDKIYHNGHYIKIPRYYLKKLEEQGFDLSDLRDIRLIRGELSNSEKSLERRKSNIDILKEKC